MKSLTKSNFYSTLFLTFYSFCFTWCETHCKGFVNLKDFLQKNAHIIIKTERIGEDKLDIKTFYNKNEWGTKKEKSKRKRMYANRKGADGRASYSRTNAEKGFSMAVLMFFGAAVIVSPFIKLVWGKPDSFSAGVFAERACQNGVYVDVMPVIPMRAANVLAQVSGYAKAAIVVDARTGEVLYASNENERLPMASTTKIMTALVAADMLDPRTAVKITPEAAGVEGSSIYLEAGETVSAQTLLCGLLLESGNDAATAIAIACCGSLEAFAQKMNDKAQSLGLSDTHFTNPHGLHDENHYTTARELAAIACAALEKDEIARIVSSKSIVCGGEFSEVSGEKVRHFTNHNKLLSFYDGACGMKTGFTKVAGRCLVSSAERDGTMLVAVTLGCPDDWDVHMQLLDFGFENFRSARLTEPGGIDLSPFGINVKAESMGERFATVAKGEQPIFDYRIDYADGKAELSVEKKQ